jgi:hypothetical protein
MKKILILFVSIMLTVCTMSQNFEGKVVYKVTILKSNVPKMTTDQLNTLMGTHQDYYVKGGYFKSVTNGTFMQWQLYHPDDNKMYNKFSNSEAIMWKDCGTNPDSIISVQYSKAKSDIAGYKCDELILTCKSGIQKYYFNTSLGMDPALYSHNLYSNWYDYLKLAKAVPLKTYIENEQMIMESTATEVKAMKVSDEQFALPKGAKLTKLPE